jgi:predicted CopG family antitoxin
VTQTKLTAVTLASQKVEEEKEKFTNVIQQLLDSRKKNKSRIYELESSLSAYKKQVIYPMKKLCTVLSIYLCRYRLPPYF